MFGRHNLEKLVYKNLVWCAPKPSNLDKSPSAFGEIAIANFFFLFFFGPSFLVLLCYTFVHLGSLLIQKKKIGRGSPANLIKKGEINIKVDSGFSNNMVPLVFVFIFVQGQTCENIKDQSPRTRGTKQEHQGLPGPDPTMGHLNWPGLLHVTNPTIS